MSRVASGTKSHTPKLIGLPAALVMAATLLSAQPAPPAIDIVAEPARTFSLNDALTGDSMQRPFAQREQTPPAPTTASACTGATQPRTVRRTLAGILGPDVSRIVVHAYLEEWRNVPEVTAYINRILSIESEWWPFQAWSQLTVAEIDASAVTRGGVRRPLELGNGFVHAVDAAGCEWWAGFANERRPATVYQPERAALVHTARTAADRFVRETFKPSQYELSFLRVEDRGDEMWVVYRKVFKEETLGNPENAAVAYNRTSGTTRWVGLE